MTSKEALKELIDNAQDMCDWELVRLNIIKKDLEVLEILKKYLYYDNENHFIKMVQIRKQIFNFDYEDLKEWLENGQRKNDRNL